MKTARESVDPHAVSKMTPADRFAFVTKMREQGQKQFAPSRRLPSELLATLDATKRPRPPTSCRVLPSAPVMMRGAVRGRPAHRR